MRVVVTRPVRLYLDGTHLFQLPDRLDEHGYGEAGRRLVDKIGAAQPYSRGAVAVDLDDDELVVLREYVETMQACARDDARWEPSARGELNAASALLRKIGAAT